MDETTYTFYDEAARDIMDNCISEEEALNDSLTEYTQPSE